MLVASLIRKSKLKKTQKVQLPRSSQDTLEQRIIACTGCPRLFAHCKKIALEKKKMFSQWEYWAQPVPNFGEINARLVIVGLAPAAHGANRTGRMFTGDQSGVWLYRALHRAGFANQANSESRADGLELFNALITAVCHCAPPDNKPTLEEIDHCRPFLRETIEQAKNRKVILALGGIAWNALSRELIALGELESPRVKFSHGRIVKLKSNGWLIGSYHPSQQNTFTGRLTEQAFDEIFKISRNLIDEVS
jgi:uracil-DNA glycosylase family 4